MAQDHLRLKESRSLARCSLKPRKSLQRGLHKSRKVRLKKRCQSLQNTLIEYSVVRINQNKSDISIEPVRGCLYLTIFQPLIFTLSFKEFDLKKDYLSVQHNYYGITLGLC